MTPWIVPLLGALPAPAYAPLDGGAWAWFCLAPLIAWIGAGRRVEGWGSAAQWLGLGWGYGLVHFALRYAWLPEALLDKGGLRPLPFVLLMTGTVAGLALYPAFVIALSRLAWQRWGLAPVWSFPPLYAAQEALLQVTPFGGAPWGSLAATQAGTWGARLIVPLAGGVGLALLLAVVNAGWAAAAGGLLQALTRRRTARRLPPAPVLGLLALVGVTPALAWPAPPPGFPEGAPGFAALLVPGDRSMRELADDTLTAESARYFLGRTAAAVAASPASADPRPALAVWPESAVSGRPEAGRVLADLFDAAQLLDTDLLFGGNARALGRLHNSAYLVSGERFRTVRYDKQRLVPFGEYVPLGFRTLLGKKLTAGVDDYTPGTGPPVVEWRDLRLGLAICFESLSAPHLRRAVAAGAEAIVAISNDGWLSPAAARHHLRLTALQGLAVGRDVLFVANRGWSAHLRGGRALRLIPPGGRPAAVRAAVREGLTPWARWGDALPLSLAGAYALLGAGIGRRRRRAR